MRLQKCSFATPACCAPHKKKRWHTIRSLCQSSGTSNFRAQQCQDGAARPGGGGGGGGAIPAVGTDELFLSMSQSRGSGLGSKGTKQPNALGSVWRFIHAPRVNAFLLVCIFIVPPPIINSDIMPTEKTKGSQKYLHSSIIRTKS
jgi:hypothetical protein